MSTVKTNAAQIGQSLTATNNFTLYQPATPDGTVRLGNGNSGSVTDLVTLNSSGNLGLGVTPSAWASGYSAFEFGKTGTALFTSASAGNVFLASNGYFDGSWKRASAGYAAYYNIQGTNGVHAWFTAPSSTAGSTFSATQAMTLDASGNLGVGTTSPSFRIHSYATGGTTVAGAFRTDQSDCYITFRSSGTASDTSCRIGVISENIVFLNNGAAERMRIDSSGNLLVGTTSNPQSAKLVVNGSVVFQDAAGQSNSVSWVNNKGVGSSGSGGFGLSYTTVNYTPSGTASNIYWDGNTGYFTLSTSSKKYKRNITPVTDDQLNKALLLEPSYYQRLEYDYWEYGLIAEQVKEIGLEEFVTYAGKEVSGLNYEKMVTLAFGLIKRQDKAIQELKAELDATKAEVAALKQGV